MLKIIVLNNFIDDQNLNYNLGSSFDNIDDPSDNDLLDEEFSQETIIDKNPIIPDKFWL